MNFPRANSPDQAYALANHAIQTGNSFIKHPEGKSATEALSRLNLAGKDILRKRAGLSRLPEIEELVTNISRKNGDPWYERETHIDTFSLEAFVFNHQVRVARVLQTVSRNTAGRAPQVSHRYSALVVQPQLDIWETGLISTQAKSRTKDQVFAEHNPVFAAEPIEQTSHRVQQAKGNRESQAKIMQGVYWDIETLAASTRQQLFKAPHTNQQSAMWVADGRSEKPPLLNIDGQTLDIAQDDWPSLITRPLVEKLWNRYLEHPEDKDESSPVLLHQHLAQAFRKATGQKFFIR